MNGDRPAERLGELAAALRSRALLPLAIALAGCSSEGERTELHVFAASSLTEAFGELERGFERASPEVDVVMSFAGSQVLRLQIEQGAPADVFASADEAHVDALARADLVSDAELFARNELVVVVPLDEPAGVESFDDLGRATRLVIGQESVPVGRYTRALLRRLGPEVEREVLARVVSEESNARLVRAKVELGEADAAIVYRTDAMASGRVRVVEIPEARRVRADYHAGVVAGSERAELARRFIAYVRSEEGRRVLREHGFVPPP